MTAVGPDAPRPRRRALLAFEPPDGGVAENVLQLAQGLADHGFDVEIAGPERSAIHSRLDGGIPIHRLPFVRDYRHPTQDARAFAKLGRLLRSGRFDLVHCHSAKAGVIGRLAARTAGTPAVYTPHCLPFIGEISARRRVVATAIERAAAHLAERIVCVCEDERRQARSAGVGNPDQLCVVYNGCGPCADIEPGLARLAEGGPVAVAVAVMRRQKRLDVLIDAAPEVLRRVPDARIAIVGEGPLANDLRTRANARGLAEEPRFAFLPFRAPMAIHLRAAAAFVLCSDWEAMPIAVLEALACGVPQVATDVGGVAEAVTPQTGVLVPPHDPAALADALSGLLSDQPRRAAMATASRSRHRELFTVERMVAQTAAVYADALATVRTRAKRIGTQAA